jgi:putative phage-type endonuclease
MDDLIQGSDAWLKIRCGKVTASRVADVIAKTKTGVSASRAKYAGELIVERLTGMPAERFTNGAMAWGTEKEPEARSTYEYYFGATVEEIGFVPHRDIADTGASPDGLVGSDGLIEIKCPESHTHIETLIGKTVPAKYVTQMQWQLCCTGRNWCDFVSYDPRLPESMRFFCTRVFRDDAMIADLEKEVIAFLNEIRAKIQQLQNIYDPQSDDANSLLMAG